MKEILNIINQLQNTSGRNDKEGILKNNKDNQLFKDVLHFVFNPYIVTGLSKKKISKKIKGNAMNQINDISEMMEYLKQNNTGTDKDITIMQEFISNQSVDLQELITQIATKSLKLGIEAKTMNKIYGKDFIPQFDVMLAEKYFECEDKVNGEFIITQKLDGIRCVIIKENSLVKVFSRQGQPIEDLIEILEEVKLLPDNMVYDGELILRNDKSLASKDLYRETVKVARKDGIKKNLIFNCFDMLPINDFKNGICKRECSLRKDILHTTLTNLKLNYIIEVPILYKGTDKNMIIKLLDEAIAKDQEGVMVNISNSPYECKRTKFILKVKKMNTCDLKIIGFEEGDGKNKGTLGRINVSYKNNIVGVGSGFTDEMRNEIWNNQEKYLNKIAEIQYFEETTNSKDDKLSLRFPVFIDMRWDKAEESYF
jgi:DNA ligase-1